MSKAITSETRLKLSLRANGVKVKVFDQSNNLINQFSSMNSAARHFDVDVSTIKRIFNTGILNDKYIYKFELRDNKVWVYDYDHDHKLIKILSNILKTSELYKIPYTTIYR